MLIDSHCHLNHNRLKHIGDPSDILKKANEYGVQGCLTICCRIHEEMNDLIALAEAHDNLWCTIGTHPHDAGDEKEMEYSVQDIIAFTNQSDKIIGIGESGLDYYYTHSPVIDQKASFRKHIQASIETDLPLVIHARDADEDIIAILKEETRNSQKPLRAVMHCFSSSPEMGYQALDLGLYISFSGILTFPKSEELREFAKDVPQDRVLVETDAPYLTPHPHRKEINHPGYTRLTAECLAELHGMSIEDIAAQTTENFFNLFTKARDTKTTRGHL